MWGPGPTGERRERPVDADTKVKELEEEFKILKAEIRNVLLDIRENILENNNPLRDDQKGAFIRMDLNTTAQTMASNAATQAASDAIHASQESAAHEAAQRPQPTAEPAPAPVEEEPAAEAPSTEVSDNMDAGAADDTPEQPAPKVIKKKSRPVMPEPNGTLPAEIPEMYRVHGSLEDVPRLSEWLGTALATVGPRELERVIAIERLWGNLPPNVMRALSYVLDLLKETEDADPPWLRVMRDLDRLSVI